MNQLLYIYGEEFTGRRAREVHTLNRVHSLTAAGMNVTLLAASSSKFTAESLLAHFNLLPLGESPKLLEGTFNDSNLQKPSHGTLRIEFLPRQVRLGPWNIVSTAFFYRNVLKWIRNQQHAGASFELVYLIHLKAAKFLATKLSKIPYVFEAHEIFADSYPEPSKAFARLKSLEHFVYSKARAVVATSNYLLAELQKQYPISSSRIIIPNSVAESFFSLTPGGDPKRLVYIGSFQHWKGVDVAVEAMRTLPDYHLDIVGGSPEQIDSHQRSAGHNVTFHGFLRQEQFAPILERAAIALIPNRLTPRSSLYSFPMKLLEYGAAGKRVIASDLPVLRELNPGSWCRLIEPENPAALAQALKDVQPRPELHAQARQWTQGYTWGKQAEQLKKFLTDLF